MLWDVLGGTGEGLRTILGELWGVPGGTGMDWEALGSTGRDYWTILVYMALYWDVLGGNRLY